MDLSAPSLPKTPQQKSVSEDVIPDCKLFKIESDGGSNVVTIIEVKTRANFNDDSVCQTIGYHMASRVSSVNEETLRPYPSLAIMICETRARLIFFPFMHERLLCMETVVSDILPNGMINPALFIFVCTYIDQLTNAAPVFITQSEVGVAFTIHPMKQHRTLLSLEVIEVARLKQKVVEDQETLQAMSQRLELVQKEKSQLEQQLKEMQKV